MYKQLVCLAKMYTDSLIDPTSQTQYHNESAIDFDLIYSRFEALSPEQRQQLIAEEPARKTSKEVIEEMAEIFEDIAKQENQEGWQITKNASDELMNLMELTVLSEIKGGVTG